MSLLYRQAPSSVRCLSAIRPSSNSFSSETTGPFKVKFHMKPPWAWVRKVCSPHLGHKTKMASMFIYVKNPLKIFFSGNERPRDVGLGMQHWGHGPNNFWKNDDIRLTLTFFTETGVSICPILHLFANELLKNADAILAILLPICDKLAMTCNFSIWPQ